MSEEIKAEHRLVMIEQEGTAKAYTYRWRCSCGEHDGGYLSDGYVRDAHAEHVQEAGEYGLPGGFVVVESLHGEACAGCRKEARSAAIHARAMGSVGATHSTMKPSDPWEDPEVDHSARVERPKSRE